MDRGGAHHHVLQALAVEDVVTEDEAALVAGDEVAADEKGLRQALGLRLLGKAAGDDHLAAVAQQGAETMMLLRRGVNEAETGSAWDRDKVWQYGVTTWGA